MINTAVSIYKRLSIRGKLLTVIVGTALIALFLGYGLVLWFNLASMRSDMEQSVRHVAGVAAEFAEAPLSFNDAKGGEEVLARLQAVSDIIVAAYLLDENGEIFSRFETAIFRSSAASVPEMLAAGEGAAGSFFVTSQSVAVSGNTVGRVLVIATLDPLFSRMYGFVLTTSAIFLVVTLVALICASKLEHHISDRIISLTDILGLLTSRQTTGTRAEDVEGMEDEISNLYDTVNLLLAEIEHREAERDRVEGLLRENENKFRAIVQDQTELICRNKNDGTLTFVNEAFCRYFDKIEAGLLGSNFYDLVPEAEIEVVKNHFNSITVPNQVVIYEHEVRLPNGETAWMEWSSRAIPDAHGQIEEYQGVGRDITDLRRAQQEKEQIQRQLYHSQRLETIGTLAGGIAHDFNNILTPLRGYVDLLQLDISADSVSGQRLAHVHNALERARQLVAGILTFSGHGELAIERSSIDIGALVESVISFVRATIPRTIVISVEKLSAVQMFVKADESKLHQALMNLCTNAFQAMEGTGGELRIVIGEKKIGREEIRPGEALEAGNCVSIVVMDTGPGIEDGVLHRIYDPFFTTKEIGKGTGLGLSVVRGIVVDHDGAIRVRSIKGQGTQFEILLPVASEGLAAAELASEPREKIVGSPLVYVVDDEKAIVAIAVELLESLGCQVLSESNPRLAADSITTMGKAPDLIITDFTMPGMSGEEFVAELRRKGVASPVILATGYSNVSLDMNRLRDLGIIKVLQKPYNLKVLKNSLSKLFASVKDVSAA